MQLAVRAVHFALQGRINCALLLDAVLAAKAFVDNHCGHMNTVIALDTDLRIRKSLAQKVLDFI